jgi:L-asparagine oxygenase
MTTSLIEDQAVSLNPDEAVDLWSCAGRLAAGADIGALGPDELVDLAIATTKSLPDRVIRAVHRYRSRGEGGDVLLLRGLLPPGTDVGTTPPKSAAPLDSPAAQRAGLCLLGVASLLGEPFNFRTLYSGKVIQNVVPVPDMEHTQTGESSSGMLDWHVEDGFSPDRCDYFALFCLQEDSTAVTEWVSARDVQLPGRVREVLAAERFHMLPDTAHVLDEVRPHPTAVLFGPEHARELCYDAHYLAPADPGDHEAAHALAELRVALDEARTGHVLRSGDLMVLDNRRVAHARTPFVPRYDGRDRWLIRTMICSSLPRFRTHGTRVIH